MLTEFVCLLREAFRVEGRYLYVINVLSAEFIYTAKICSILPNVSLQ
jgi:hypothetical protein